MIFKNQKAHVKKLNSFQHFGNISTDSESPAIKFFRTGLQKLTKIPILLTIFLRLKQVATTVDHFEKT